jgi:hypothetical protein
LPWVRTDLPRALERGDADPLRRQLSPPCECCAPAGADGISASA